MKQISTFNYVDEGFSDLAVLFNFQNDNSPTKTEDSSTSNLFTKSKHNANELEEDVWDAQIGSSTSKK